MAPKNFVEQYMGDFLGNTEGLTKIRKPIIAAVNGYALGGINFINQQEVILQ
jgi:enoyl-CoA hydratase